MSSAVGEAELLVLTAQLGLAKEKISVMLRFKRMSFDSLILIDLEDKDAESNIKCQL